MYNINFDKYFNILNWGCIYWGIKNRLINAESAVVYANKSIEQNPNTEINEIIELLIVDTSEKDTILSLIESMFSHDQELEKKKDIYLRKLRYILLLEIQDSKLSNHDLLYKIEKIYSDFGYPSDMEGFISYMPVQTEEYDSSEHSIDDNEQRLADKFMIFMNKESDETSYS